jgi:arabinose-5-phosphate isomerase
MLGKRLMRVEALMHSGPQCPVVRVDTRMRDVIYQITSKTLGMTCVVDADGRLAGIITDGDLRRHMDMSPGILALTAVDVMTRDPVTILPSTIAAEALSIMERRKITSLVVVESGGRSVAGVVHLHDLWPTENT